MEHRRHRQHEALSHSWYLVEPSFTFRTALILHGMLKKVMETFLTHFSPHWHVCITHIAADLWAAHPRYKPPTTSRKQAMHFRPSAVRIWWTHANCYRFLFLADRPGSSAASRSDICLQRGSWVVELLLPSYHLAADQHFSSNFWHQWGVFSL